MVWPTRNTALARGCPEPRARPAGRQRRPLLNAAAVNELQLEPGTRRLHALSGSRHRHHTQDDPIRANSAARHAERARFTGKKEDQLSQDNSAPSSRGGFIWPHLSGDTQVGPLPISPGPFTGLPLALTRPRPVRDGLVTGAAAAAAGAADARFRVEFQVGDEVKNPPGFSLTYDR
jgi:hypothetical protein